MTSTARITPSSPASPRAGRHLDLLGPRPPVSNERLRYGSRLSEAAGSPRRGRGEGAQEAHADEPLQRPAANGSPDAHEALDAAVAAAYGWSADISDDEVRRELLALTHGLVRRFLRVWRCEG